MATAETRQRPNILVTGTPGTGKSTLSQQVAERLGFDYLEIGKIVRENGLFTEFDEDYNSHVLDEDKLLDFIEERMDSDQGGTVVDYHGSEFFPERWFDFIFVLRCSNDVLYPRLERRGYNDRKITENIQCEIFGSLAEEARDAFKPEIVYELPSETVEQMNDNVDKISEMVSAWKQ